MSARIRLEPLGRILDLESGQSLRDPLLGAGVEFPCGGRGRCRRCRVRVLEGAPPPTTVEREILGERGLAAGWRLACRMAAVDGLALEVGSWEPSILVDSTAFAFAPREGLGIAVDVGTTTLVAQALDLRSGRVIGVRTALNPQAAHGADVMSRLQLALTGEGRRLLRNLVRAEVGAMVEALVLDVAGGESPTVVTLVGNTAMHHLFCDIEVAPLAAVPFAPVDAATRHFRPRDLGWDLGNTCEVRFLRCIGGFVGSDVLAGIVATGLAESDSLVGLVDLGTNGEIVVGSRRRIVCASTAAGPAFEGGRISCGMRAATGAVAEVTIADGRLVPRVIGGTEARGICGSGLVDAVACGLDAGLIRADGALARGRRLEVAPSVHLTQADIREVQLAKGAIAAGLRILLRRLGVGPGRLTRLYLAGAFGNDMNRESASRIGLLEFAPGIIEPVGNTALLGAKLALFATDGSDWERLSVEHIPLASDPEFEDVFVDSLRFP